MKSGVNEKTSFSLNTFMSMKNAINLYDDVLNAEDAYQYLLKNLERKLTFSFHSFFKSIYAFTIKF